MRLAYATLTLDVDAPCRIMVNGLPLLDDTRPAQMEWMEILDLWMLAQNQLEIDIAAAPDVTVTADLRLSLHGREAEVSADTGTPLPADLRQAVAGGWQPVAPDATGRYSFHGTGGVRAIAVFATHGPDYSAALRPSRPLDPADAVRLAASVLQSLAQGSVEPVLRLMAPRIADIAKSWEADPAQVSAAHSELLSAVADAEARRSTAPVLTPVQFGPLVEVRRDGGPLFRSDGGEMEMPAFFGWTTSAVAIVR